MLNLFSWSCRFLLAPIQGDLWPSVVTGWSKPSLLQTTAAVWYDQFWSHSRAHWPLWRINTWPSLSFLPPTSRIGPCWDPSLWKHFKHFTRINDFEHFKMRSESVITPPRNRAWVIFSLLFVCVWVCMLNRIWDIAQLLIVKLKWSHNDVIIILIFMKLYDNHTNSSR